MVTHVHRPIHTIWKTHYNTVGTVGFLTTDSTPSLGLLRTIFTKTFEIPLLHEVKLTNSITAFIPKFD